jgi:thiamine-monophosphate kinase
MTPAVPASEEDIIQQYLAPLAAGYAGAFGLRDDCATITPPPNTDLVIKTDPVRAGVHFFADDAPEDIAWKALAVNMSDLAAKGATPLAYVLALSFPSIPETPWLARFAQGLAAAQSAFGCHLIGGDTDRAAGPLSIAVTAFGVVETGKMVRRGTASAADYVYVSGTLGGSALGLKLRRGDADTADWPINSDARSTLLTRYLRPQPRLALAQALRAHATAAMDISDGLCKDFDRLCRASGVGGRLDLSRLPLSVGAREIVAAAPHLNDLIWGGGDDYEILCTVPQSQAEAFESGARAVTVPVTRIGLITAGRHVTFHKADGAAMPINTLGWDHF